MSGARQGIPHLAPMLGGAGNAASAVTGRSSRRAGEHVRMQYRARGRRSGVVIDDHDGRPHQRVVACDRLLTSGLPSALGRECRRPFGAIEPVNVSQKG